MESPSLKKVAAAIRKYKRFLISSHTSPEGDALGSELAFYYLLKSLGKQAIIVNEDPLPQECGFFPGKDKVRLYNPGLRDINFDCVVILDCSDLGRIGQVQGLIKGKFPIINIDHHISNNKFGDINLVDAKASSASEIIFKLHKEMHTPLNKDSALLLYAGILTDTGSFRYSNTTSFTHQAAGEMLRFNFNVNQVYRDMYENIPFTDIQLLSKVLAHIHRTAGGRIAWVEVPAKLLRHKKITFDLSDHILSFIRSIKDTQVVALFKENLGGRNEIRFNLRSNGKVDVNKIARSFGGGGHKTASGCTISGRLSRVREKVIARIRQDLK